MLVKYWIAHVTIGLLRVEIIFSTRMFYWGVLRFATDCPVVVSCRGLTIYLLYVGRSFGISDISFKRQLICKFDITGHTFSFFFLIMHSLCIYI